ncbi:hypothetical protein EX895_003078 [Sporisorium graminicola]|uniref:Actin cytoskeleton-regulatory complex protein SLA1 n=1 Tax=Sporisorium graminicola TaxID=280036 RepID=A0A4U7KYP0_9BASI|nr:hypothetical protein EX895_003078 [Sporisorium graminicola]TKY87982.1 hypothetical protein EX895_003078 [Sporisorium graminicola]
MAYVALGKALYDYVAQAEDELNLTEDDYLYILESDDPEWWKAKLRRLAEDGTPIQDDSDEGTVGLVPANYVEEAEPLRLSRALYDYEAQTEDELSMVEDELLRVYESDGVWLLVKKQGQDPLSGGEGRLGYVPANYVDEAEAVDTGAAPVVEDEYAAEEEDDEDDDTGSGAAIPQIQLPQTANLGRGDEIKMWPVSALDSKKKKKKGTLGIGNASLFFASESDKTPVKKISVLHIVSHSLEKGKTLHLNLSPEAVLSESTLDFHTGSKDAANDIVKKIEESMANAQSASAAAPPSSASAPAPAVSSGSIPLPPPPPPAPPAPAAALPPPTRNASATLPLPVRKTVSFQSQQATAVAPEPEEAVEHAIAMYDFEAQGDDELTVTENEHLIILEKENDDWWKVRNDAGQEGVVPASYVEASDAAATGGTSSSSAAALAAEQEEEERRRQEEEEAAAVAEAERQREAAESAARRRREAEERRGREETERTRREALKAQPAPAPPKLTQRPSTTEVSRAAKNVSIPQGRSAPERPKDGGGRSKPSPNNTRMWTDRTGTFKVEAEFLGFNQGKIRLHKMNGVVIEVAVEKMSNGDIQFLEDITGKKLNPTDEEIAASTARRRERERERERQSSRSQPSSASGMTREERERERERRKEKEREQRRREQARTGPKRNVDWFEFFLAAGVDVDDCTRYASSFERDKIDETVLADLDAGTLRSIGLREGDIIRVTKFIDKKYRRDKTHSTSSSSRQSGRANANTAANLEDQIKADEELARKLQEQESSARRGDSVSPAPPQLFSGPDGTLKNNTRRGRPTPKSTGGSNVDAASLAAATESLARTATPPARAGTVSPAAPKRTGSSLANGFDDDAWTPRPPSTKPATPARPSAASPAPAPTPPPAPAAAAAAASPAPVVSPAPAADPNSALFEKLAAMKPPSASASPRPGASPSPGSMFLGQSQGYNPNAPRGPFAPVPANQGLLQPLVPTQGTGQFVPTKTGMMGMQMTGMQPQQTGWGMQAVQGVQGMQGMQPQMTGFQNGMGGAGQMGGMGMQPQATGFGNGGGYMNGSSPFAGGQINTQQTGFPGMQPQQTGFNNFGQTPQQVMAQQTGFGLGSQQQVQQQQAAQDEKDKFNASNIFQQMKTGAFAKDPNAAPQASGKYDALRPQPTGFQPGGVMPQFTGMGFGQQPQQPQQPYPHNGYGGGFGGY